MCNESIVYGDWRETIGAKIAMHITMTMITALTKPKGFSREVLGEGGETANIAKQHADLTPLTAQAQLLLLADQSAHHGGRDVAAKQCTRASEAVSRSRVAQGPTLGQQRVLVRA